MASNSNPTLIQRETYKGPLFILKIKSEKSKLKGHVSHYLSLWVRFGLSTLGLFLRIGVLLNNQWLSDCFCGNLCLISEKGSKLLFIADFHGEGTCGEALRMSAWEVISTSYFSVLCLVAFMWLTRKSCHNREIRIHIYAKRQTWIWTTWPSFPLIFRSLFIASTPKKVVSCQLYP